MHARRINNLMILNYTQFINESSAGIGNLARDKSVHDLAVMHGVDDSVIQSELEMGKEVELEHTTDPDTATAIAMDHLAENPRYYTELKKIELESTLANEAKGVRPVNALSNISSDAAIKMLDLNLIGMSELVLEIDTWKWRPELILYYIRSIKKDSEVEVSYRPSKGRINLVYHTAFNEPSATYVLEDDAGGVAGWIENRFYGEDDGMDPYGGDENSNSLANKIKAFITYPYEYTGQFQ